MNDWFEYVKSCYDLVLESEDKTKVFLQHDIEAYVVHLMAKNFNNVNITGVPVSIKILQSMQNRDKDELLKTGDECLIIHSYPLNKPMWPCNSYYEDLGMIAYGMANHMMEKNFKNASIIISNIFNNNIKK